jgi:hypothetical protein
MFTFILGALGVGAGLFFMFNIEEGDNFYEVVIGSICGSLIGCGAVGMLYAVVQAM